MFNQPLTPPLKFPNVRNWSDLVESFSYDKFPNVRVKGTETVFSSFTTVDVMVDGDSRRAPTVNLKLRDEIAEQVARDLVVADTMYFKLVVHPDEVLFIVSYNRILGSRWLARLDESTLPVELRKALDDVRQGC